MKRFLPMTATRLIALGLAALLALPPYSGRMAHAQSADENSARGGLSEADIQDYQEFSQKVRALREKFGGLSGETHAWDTWRLLDQHVVDERLEQIEEKVQQIHASDPDGELKIEDMVDREVKHRFYNQLNLRFQIKGDPMRAALESANNERIVHEILESNVKNSLAAGANTDSLFYVLQGDGKHLDYHFQITDRNGHPLHIFHRPISSIGLFGNFLIYTDQNAYDPITQTVMVRFVDLDFFRPALGNSALPVYSFPLKVDGPVREMKVVNGELIINGRTIPYDAMKVLAWYQQILFNTSVAMVDPETQRATEPLLEEMINFMDLALGQQEVYIQKALVDAFGGSPEFRQYLNVTTQAAMARKDLKKLKPFDLKAIQGTNDLDQKTKIELEEAVKTGLNDENFKQSLLRTNRNLQLSNRFVARMNAYISRIASPQPMGSPTIIKSLAMVAEGRLRGEEEILKSGQAGLKNNPRIQRLKKYFKWGSAAAAGAIIGTQLPEPYTIHLSQALDLPGFILDQVHDYFRRWNYGFNLVEMGYHGLTTPARSLVEVPNQYFLNGRLPKFVVGLSSVVLTPIIYYAVPHTIVNTIKASRYVWKNWRQYKSDSLTILGAIKESFIDYARKEQHTYEMALAEAEAKNSGGDARTLHGEDLERFDEITQRIETENLGFFGRQFVRLGQAYRSSKSKTARLLYTTATQIGFETELQLAASGAMMRVAEGLQEKKTLHNVDTLGQALKSFLLSFQAVANTDRVLGTVWNYFFISRSFIWYPKMWAMAMLFPKYFRTAISTTPGKVFMPNEWNGGLRMTWPTITNFIKLRKGVVETAALSELEKKLLPLDAIVQEEALYKATVELIRRSKDPEKVMTIFDSRRLINSKASNSEVLASAGPSTGIIDVTDETISHLDSEDAMFFRAYYVRIADETMKRVLLKRAQKLDLLNTENLLTPERVKKEVIKSDQEILFQASPELRQEVQFTMDEIQSEGKVKSWANQVTKGILNTAQRWALNFRFDTIKRLHPNGGQLERFLISEKQLKDPNALARAVRDVIAKLLISKPIKLMSILAFYASIDDGLLKPIYDEKNGPNSINYLSRYLFYTGFAVDTIISIMADTWLKLQKDYRLVQKKAFDKVPMYQDRIKGFWRYYMKNLTKNPNNRWWQNQSYMIRLITSNIPAYAITSMIAHLTTMGRWDLGVVFNGYAQSYLTPTMGLEAKAESAFEITSTQHITAKIPRELRASPEAQRWIGTQIQKKRMVFNIAFQLALEVWATVQEAAFWHKIPEVGSRSFERMFFHGNTVAETLAKFFRLVAEATNQLPASVDNAVDKTMNACEKLFTNNYTDWKPGMETTEQFYKNK